MMPMGPAVRGWLISVPLILMSLEGAVPEEAQNDEIVRTVILLLLSIPAISAVWGHTLDGRPITDIVGCCVGAAVNVSMVRFFIVKDWQRACTVTLTPTIVSSAIGIFVVVAFGMVGHGGIAFMVLPPTTLSLATFLLAACCRLLLGGRSRRGRHDSGSP